MENMQSLLLIYISIGVLAIFVTLICIIKKWKGYQKNLRATKIRFFLETGKRHKWGHRIVELIDSFEKASKYNVLILGLLTITRKTRTFQLSSGQYIDISYDPANKDFVKIGYGWKDASDPNFLFTDLSDVPIEIDNLIKNKDNFEEYVLKKYCDE